MVKPTDWIPSLWVETFEELQDDDNELDYGDEWTLNFNYTLTDKLTTEQRRRGWRVFCYHAHGHFKCTSCKKIWPSAQVTVLFHYRLRGGRGTVIMRPFGQACRSCQNNTFYLPGFYKEEVEKALLRLCAKIRKNCYRDEDVDDDGGSVSPKVWTKPHEKTLCEACRMGICCQDDE
ncbi:receptor-transporting protein 3-like [Plectropomus leopardus]|uniref:receptor-transporting protein 3-like n=1 Tax=Plectropomus leopardus TaxID=160734 RepID=UPI001C4C5D41|nr:receptor-transporting protein 3-like [Plectropomus leopardus]